MMLSPQFIKAVLAGIEGTLGELVAKIADGTLNASLELIASEIADVRKSISRNGSGISA